MHVFVVAFSSSVESVCPGEVVSLTCNTNGTLLEWRIVLPDRSDAEMRLFGSLGSANHQTPLIVNHTEFRFTRSSIIPLISTMTIENVITGLNGTIIECSYHGIVSTTLLYVIKIGIRFLRQVVLGCQLLFLL